MVESLKVGLAGLGTVGSSVVRILQDKSAKLTEAVGRPVELVAFCAKDIRDQSLDLSKLRRLTNPADLAADPGIDVVVELMGGEGDPAKSTVETALKSGKAVVTANKALIAAHGAALARLAEDNGVAFNFEAAVAGGIPVIKTMREGLVANRIDRVWGILNGTCNYILTRMFEEKLAFADCLKEAQRLGYAEADPTFDIDGFDTAHKLAILTSLAFGTEVDKDAIYVEGIRQISLADLEMADELGYRVKLLGVAVRTEAGHRAARPPHHGAQGGAARPGRRRHQRGQDRRRQGVADPDRPRRRRPGHRVRGGGRPRRHRPRHPRGAVRPPGRHHDQAAARADAAARRRLLHKARRRRQARHRGHHRPADGRRADLAGVDRAAAARPPRGSTKCPPRRRLLWY